VLGKRVHRVENWVSNLFKYYFFFFSRSPLDWQAVRAVFGKKVGSVVVGSFGGCVKEEARVKEGEKKRSGLVRVWIKRVMQ